MKEEWPKEMRIRQVSFSERKNSQIGRPSLCEQHLPSIDHNHKDRGPQPAVSNGKERKVTYKDIEAKKRFSRDFGPQRESRRSSKDKAPAIKDRKRSSQDTGALLIHSKKRASQVYRDLRVKAPVDPGDRAELFIMQSPSPKWRSHWTGPL